MARGWESKSVESQQFEAPGSAGRSREDAAADELDRRRKRESLEMSRRRIQRELEGARSPTHRAALENALQHLDGEIGKLR